MIRPIKVCDILGHNSANEFEVVRKYETVDAMCGIEHRRLTDDDIKALKEGKYLYCNDGEYAQVISYEPSEGERGDKEREKGAE